MCESAYPSQPPAPPLCFVLASQFYLADDRLYYSADALRDKPVVEGAKTRYIALDRIPVRPLPHR